MDDLRGIAFDGRPVTLGESSWTHIQSQPGRAFAPGDVLDVAARPAFVVPDRRYADRVLCYGRQVGPSEYLAVILEDDGDHYRIITAHPVRRLPGDIDL